MKRLSKPTKCDMLLNIFDSIGKKMKAEKVCQVTGIKSYNSLKALLSYIRKSKHVPNENRIDVRIQDGTCVRVG
jgi:cell division septal protein FtsQ